LSGPDDLAGADVDRDAVAGTGAAALCDRDGMGFAEVTLGGAGEDPPGPAGPSLTMI